MSSAVLQPVAPEARMEHSEGVWHAAWRRFKSDRVGMVSLWIVAAFLVLIALAALGFVAVTFTTSANDDPAASSTAPIFANVCRACSTTSSPPTSRPSASTGTQPETNSSWPMRTASV